MARRSRRGGLFGGLLRLFPAEFRGDFGSEMAADFQDQRAARPRKAGARSPASGPGRWSTSRDGYRSSTWTCCGAMPATPSACCAGDPGSRRRSC